MLLLVHLMHHDLGRATFFPSPARFFSQECKLTKLQPEGAREWFAIPGSRAGAQSFSPASKESNGRSGGKDETLQGGVFSLWGGKEVP